jgi:hypothetical protein
VRLRETAARKSRKLRQCSIRASGVRPEFTGFSREPQRRAGSLRRCVTVLLCLRLNCRNCLGRYQPPSSGTAFQ